MCLAAAGLLPGCGCVPACSVGEAFYKRRLASPYLPSPVQHSFDDEGEAVGLFLQLLRAKRMRGYQGRYRHRTFVDYSILELLELARIVALGKEIDLKKAQTSAAGSLSK